MSPQPSDIDIPCTTLKGVLTCLTRASTAGLTMQVAASLLSLGSILYAAFFIVNANRHTSTRIRIFYDPIDLFIFSLLCADCVQAVGGLISMKWIQDGISEVGRFCNAQGFLKVFGETGVALSTLLVTVHTFIGVLTGRVFESMKIAAAIVVGIWIFISILIAVAYGTSHKSSFFSPVPYWCWVSEEYRPWQIMGEYLWMWITSFASLLLYIPLYLWMRGNLVFTESVWSIHWTVSDPNLHSTHRKALMMLMYPIVYCVCIIPLSVVRWITFTEEAKNGVNTMPPTATFIAITLFHLSGFFNVFLVLKTRPNLRLFGQRGSSGRPSSYNHFSIESNQEVEEVQLRTIKHDNFTD